jgi:hypothetical protein
MATRITCPDCHAGLLIPPGCDTPSLSCPRCLARMPNPQAPSVPAPEPTAPAITGIQTEPPAAGGPATGGPASTTCPDCGHAIQEGWYFCPECGASLRGQRPRGRPSEVDLDVRRDSRRTGVGLILLAVLGGLGILYILVGGAVMMGEGEPGLLLVLVVGLGILGGLSAWQVSRRGQATTTAARVGQTVFGVLTKAGILLAALLILGLAALTFLFIACMTSGGPRF